MYNTIENEKNASVGTVNITGFTERDTVSAVKRLSYNDNNKNRKPLTGFNVRINGECFNNKQL